ncbi:MAG: hypothetical protein NE327_18880 [Lentisphaeraceae bacterium]|nr:hypothetical protein [Lentisphaeraceae bacterium]
MTVSKVSFDQVNYLLSLLINEPMQKSKMDDGKRHNSYSCKLQKCFAHLTEISENCSELTVQQDGELSSRSVNSSVNLVNHVSDVVDEVGQEISGLLKKLKAKNKANAKLEAEFERLSKILDNKVNKDL